MKSKTRFALAITPVFMVGVLFGIHVNQIAAYHREGFSWEEATKVHFDSHYNYSVRNSFVDIITNGQMHTEFFTNHEAHITGRTP